MAINVDLVYIYVVNKPEFAGQHNRFISSYAAHPPGYSHRTIVVFNGGDPSEFDLRLISNLQNSCYIVRDNSGLDLGGFFDASLKSDRTICIYCGSNVHFWKSGWMARMVEAWKKHGPGLYGASASYEVSPHLNTTGFWCSPTLMNSYPYEVATKHDRYDFEHGLSNRSMNTGLPDTHQCMTFWRRCFKQGLPVLLVTWDGEYSWWYWRKPPNIFRRGDQSNMLLWWKHTDLWAQQTEDVKTLWSKSTDILTDRTFNLARRQFK